MIKSLIVAIATSLLLQTVNATAGCEVQYFQGASPEIRNPAIQRETRKVCASGFALAHSGISRTPLWSGERLTRDRVIGAENMKRRNSFHTEEELPEIERAELKDYSRTGYDRGHMAPSGDMPDAQSQYESFSLANMIPQNPDDNRRLWEGIESAVRTLVKREGDLYVITGPLFEGASLKQLHGRVMVPTRIYKAVYDPKRREAGAYLVNNAPGMAYEVVSVAAIEKLSGLDLFPGMSSQIKGRAMNLPSPTPHGYGSGKWSQSDQPSGRYGEQVSYAVEHEAEYYAAHGLFNGFKHYFFR